MKQVKLSIEKINVENVEGFSIASNEEYDYLVSTAKRNVHVHVYLDNNTSYQEIEFGDYYINTETDEIFKASYETDYQSLRENKFIFSKIVGSTRYLDIIDLDRLEFVDYKESIFGVDSNKIVVLKNNFTRDEIRSIALNLLANSNVNKLLGKEFDPDKWLEEKLNRLG